MNDFLAQAEQCAAKIKVVDESNVCKGSVTDCLWERSGCTPDCSNGGVGCAARTLADLAASPAMPLIQKVSSGGTAEENAELGAWLVNLGNCAATR